ncbi:hypothetical protein ABLT40_09625 [Acinetobacter schindleri]|uniref:hypothetical protein n=1 Tax=Acinetobacter schindleri TaxID=108981 RepID=UPI0032B3C4FC
MWLVLIIIAVVIGIFILAMRARQPAEDENLKFLKTQQNRSKDEVSSRSLPPPFPMGSTRRKDANKIAPKRIFQLDYDGSHDFDNYPFEIVGESHYQSNIERFAIKREGEGCFTEVEAKIIREFNNSHDKNACRVDIKGLTVGYFPRNNAESWVKLLGRLNMPDNSEVYVKAVIVGGGSKDHSFGVRLDIPSRVANSAKYIKEV